MLRTTLRLAALVFALLVIAWVLRNPSKGAAGEDRKSVV